MKTVGILLLGSLLVVAFGYFTIFSGSTTTEVTPATEVATSSTAGLDGVDPNERRPFAGTGSIRSLYERGGSIECQITYTPSSLEDAITGNLFTADGRVRADFVVPTPDLSGQAVASIIYNTPTLYMWTEIDGQTYGAKQNQPTFAGLAESTAAIDYDAEVVYDCLTWPAVDNTIFVPPAGVLFTEGNQNMEFGTLYEDERGELPL